MLDGPNAGLGHHSALEVIEAQIGYVLGALDHLDRTGGPLEVSAAAETAYTREIDRRAAETVWLRGGCRSWYVDAVGPAHAAVAGPGRRVPRAVRALRPGPVHPPSPPGPLERRNPP